MSGEWMHRDEYGTPFACEPTFDPRKNRSQRCAWPVRAQYGILEWRFPAEGHVKVLSDDYDRDVHLDWQQGSS